MQRQATSSHAGRRPWDGVLEDFNEFRDSARRMLANRQNESTEAMDWLALMAYGQMKRLRNTLIDTYPPRWRPQGLLAQAFAEIVEIAEQFVDPECPDDGFNVELKWVREIRDHGWDRAKLDCYN